MKVDLAYEKGVACRSSREASWPDNPAARLSPEYLAAVSALETELASDLDLDCFSPEGEGSEEGGLADTLGFRRLAAACALLRLARVHDTRLHVLPYYKLAFTMQARGSPSVCCQK